MSTPPPLLTCDIDSEKHFELFCIELYILRDSYLYNFNNTTLLIKIYFYKEDRSERLYSTTITLLILLVTMPEVL